MSKAFLLVGSPKGTKSSSRVLGTYLASKLAAGGMETSEMIVGRALRSGEDLERMLAEADAADVLVVAFPLYVDSLPGPLTQALEAIADRRKVRGAERATEREPKLLAVVNCGFPETLQNEPAVAIMKKFAAEAGFHWAGGLALGMGGAVSGSGLEKRGGMVRNVVKALDLTAEALLKGADAPAEAVELMARPLIPKWLYFAMANMGWKQQARKHGVRRQMRARPYA
jgi:hypothetical protein